MNMNASSETTIKEKSCGKDCNHRGVYHWVWERLTSIALVPLTVWLVCSMVSLRNADYADFTFWLRTMPNGVLLIALIAIAFYHGVLGLQVVTDDYVSNQKSNNFTLLVVRAVFSALAFISLYSIVKIAF